MNKFLSLLINTTKHVQKSKILPISRNFSDKEKSYVNTIACDADGIKEHEIYWNEKSSIEFQRLLPDVIRHLCYVKENKIELIPAYKRLAKQLQKKLTQGDKKCGLAVFQSYEILKNSPHFDTEMKRLALVMGWCVEILHKSVEQEEKNICSTHSKTEEEGPRKENEARSVQKTNDPHLGRLLDSSVYQLLNDYFQELPSFVKIIQLFQKASQYAMLGLTLDKDTHEDKLLHNFTMNRYLAITKYKKAYNTFTLPVLLSLYLANITDEEVHRQVKTVTLEMGHIYQVQRDYDDCYNKEARHINISTGTCDWLSVVALQRANCFQRTTLQENYGKDREENINKVKQLYNEIGVRNTYKISQDRSYHLLSNQIQQCSRGLPHDLFFKLMETFNLKQNLIINQMLSAAN